MNYKSTDLAYTAGLFDGEGSIVIVLRKNTNSNKSPQHWLQVKITMTDKKILYWLEEMYGGHISTNSSKEQRECWLWRIVSNEARDFLILLLPYLRNKKERAILAVEFQNIINYEGKQGKKLTDKIISDREWYREEIGKLNLRPVAN